MRKLKRWFRDFFAPESFNDMDVGAIGEAFNDSQVRSIWLVNCFEELKRLHMDVDKRLLLGNTLNLKDLCARRKAYQEILESVLSAKRQATQDVRQNPKPKVLVDLDRVTA